MEEKSLFSHFLLVRLERDPDPIGDASEAVVPRVKYSFSAHEEEAGLKYLNDVPYFCFPESDLEKLEVMKPKRERFTFVITNAEGTQIFGFCERIHQRSSTNRQFPDCLCIMSKYPYFNLFTAILGVLESLPDLEVHADQVLSNLAHMYPFPKAGETFKVKVSMPNEKSPKKFTFTRPIEDSKILASSDFAPLFTVLKVHQVLALFSSLLMERRILFISDSISQLSNVIHSCHTLLYPFFWQHIFIPLLPRHLIHFITAPIPFVIGLHSTSESLEWIHKHPLSKVEIIDLNKRELTFNHQDWVRMPNDLWNSLNGALNRIISRARKSKTLENAAIADNFRAFFVNLFWKYPDSILSDADDVHFDTDGFINDSQNQYKEFLKHFKGSQMYERFIGERVDAFRTKTHIHGQFEKDVASRRRLQMPVSGLKFIGNHINLSTNVRKLGDKTKGFSNKMYDGVKKVYDDQIGKRLETDADLDMGDFDFLKPAESLAPPTYTQFGELHEKFKQEQKPELPHRRSDATRNNVAKTEVDDFLLSGWNNKTPKSNGDSQADDLLFEIAPTGSEGSKQAPIEDKPVFTLEAEDLKKPSAADSDDDFISGHNTPLSAVSSVNGASIAEENDILFNFGKEEEKKAENNGDVGDMIGDMLISGKEEPSEQPEPVMQPEPAENLENAPEVDMAGTEMPDTAADGGQDGALDFGDIDGEEDVQLGDETNGDRGKDLMQVLAGEADDNIRFDPLSESNKYELKDMSLIDF